MTLLHDHEPVAAAADAERRLQRVPWDVAAVVVAIAAFELFVVQAGGGRDEGSVTRGLLSLAPALLLTRPWARLGPGVLAIAALPACGALVMCVVSPLAWAAADQLATASYAGLLFIAVAAAATTTRRRYVLATAVAATAVWQGLYALWVWTAGGDVAAPLFGTYYWHNPFAVHLAVGALLLWALCARRPPASAKAAIAGLAVCLLSVVLSTSRATGALLVLLLVAVAVPLLSRRGQRAAVCGRAGVVAAATAALAVLVIAPLGGTGSGGLGQRAADEGFGENGAHRLSFYKAGVAVVAGDPWTGVGAGGYTAAATVHQGPLEARARNVHSGPLQAAVEGGIPLAAAYSLPLAAAGVALRRRLRTGRDPLDTVVLHGAGAAAALLVGHSLVDFDWTFPALPVLLAAVLALVVSVPVPGPARGASRRSRAAVALVVLLLVALASSARADAADAAVRARVTPTDAQALVGVTGPLRDPRFDRIVLSDPSAGRVAIEAALVRTADRARRDITLEWVRAEALVRAGRPDSAVRAAAAAWSRARDSAPLQAAGYARVLDAAGRPGQAEQVLADAARRLMALGPDGARRAETLVLAALRRPAAVQGPVLDCLVVDLVEAFPSSRLQPLTLRATCP